MDISEIEVPALDTTIMGTIGQMVDLVNNGMVKVITRTLTKVTTTIMAHMAIVKNQYNQHSRIGVIVNMTTILNKMVIMASMCHWPSLLH